MLPSSLSYGREFVSPQDKVTEQKEFMVLVAASTECFAGLPLSQAIDRLMDLEYTSVEIAIHEDGNQLRPSVVAKDVDAAIDTCMLTHRASIIAYSVKIDAEGEEYYRQWLACCRLAKATKVVTLTVPSAELGTPFNQEVEHLQRLVALAESQGVRVAIKSQIGRLSEDPDTVIVLCDNVKGLGVTLDPSHYLCNPTGPKEYDRLLKYVYHVHLRDSTKTKLQVRIGQGEIEYGRLINMLKKVRYDRSFSVDIREIEGVEHVAELRKMRLLVESLM
jgi:sugar phosphate isomerase/epimerase